MAVTESEQAALEECGGYLSRCRPYLNRLQRERRARVQRIDYEPCDAAATILQSLAVGVPWRAVIDQAVTEWAEARGLIPE